MPGESCGGGEREAISGFTASSRRNLLRLLNQIDQDRAPASEWRFGTLTYHQDPPTPRQAKRQLKRLLQRLLRQCPEAAGFWKLEPQKRGAPHFHLLVWTGCSEWSDSEVHWWATNWHEIAGNGSVHHLGWHLGKLGNKPCIEQLRDWSGVASYAGKYLGKLTATVDGWQWPGRFWGVFGRDRLPITIETHDLTWQQATQARRLIESWRRHQPTQRFRYVRPAEPVFKRAAQVWRGPVKRVKSAGTFGGSYELCIFDHSKRSAGSGLPGTMIEPGTEHQLRPYHRRRRGSSAGVECYIPGQLARRMLSVVLGIWQPIDQRVRCDSS